MTAVTPGGQLPFDYGHEPSHLEDDFIEGEGNRLALAAPEPAKRAARPRATAKK